MPANSSRRAFCLSVVAAAAAGRAAARPDFSGNWELDKSRSDFKALPAPDRMTRSIRHRDPELLIHSDQTGRRGRVTTQLRYTTDGKECTNTLQGGPAKGTARWVGDALVVDSRRTLPQGDIRMVETWRLVDQDKSLSIDLRIITPTGENQLKLVFTKQ